MIATLTKPSLAAEKRPAALSRNPGARIAALASLLMNAGLLDLKLRLFGLQSLTVERQLENLDH